MIKKYNLILLCLFSFSAVDATPYPNPNDSDPSWIAAQQGAVFATTIAAVSSLCCVWQNKKTPLRRKIYITGQLVLYSGIIGGLSAAAINGDDHGYTVPAALCGGIIGAVSGICGINMCNDGCRGLRE